VLTLLALLVLYWCFTGALLVQKYQKLTQKRYAAIFHKHGPLAAQTLDLHEGDVLLLSGPACNSPPSAEGGGVAEGGGGSGGGVSGGVHSIFRISQILGQVPLVASSLLGAQLLV
jgi:hypothetical protein